MQQINLDSITKLMCYQVEMRAVQCCIQQKLVSKDKWLVVSESLLMVQLNDSWQFTCPMLSVVVKSRLMSYENLQWKWISAFTSHYTVKQTTQQQWNMVYRLCWWLGAHSAQGILAWCNSLQQKLLHKDVAQVMVASFGPLVNTWKLYTGTEMWKAK